MTPPEIAARLEALACDPAREHDLGADEHAALLLAAVALRERDRDVEEALEFGLDYRDSGGSREDLVVAWTARRASTEKR